MTKRTNGRKSLNDYYNATQYRVDTWTRVKSLSKKLLSNKRGDKEALKSIRDFMAYLQPIEAYWGFPGTKVFDQLLKHLKKKEYEAFSHKASRIASVLINGEYRRKHIALGSTSGPDKEFDSEDAESADESNSDTARARPYFEVLIVDKLTPAQCEEQRKKLTAMRSDDDRFTYAPIFVSTLEDALIAISLNYTIQAIVVRSDIDLHSENDLPFINQYLQQANIEDIKNIPIHDYGMKLIEMIARLRPALDIYYVTDQLVEEAAGRMTGACRRVFYNHEDVLELHLNILSGVESRYNTPFFNALTKYAKKPTGVFHALPISRAKSILKSHWIQDMGEFYGMNIFLAETSTTSGGLDSLLEPQGPIKEAQALAARAFGSQHTFFATNGTSTCNKIVVQALVQPGDIVLVDRDCHKSHHYGLVLMGAHAVYLDSYPLSEYSMYGAVPLETIKRNLLQLRKEGKLDRVKMLLLTNCTFDGVVYNVQRVVDECLAIKPDLIFLWDEAWFGFARFNPSYKQRTAMFTAGKLAERYKSDAYRKEYEKFKRSEESCDPNDIEACLAHKGMPDPDKVRIRLYSTQSTHKTLTALRQGSMIHIYDQEYKNKVEESFHEAYMTHTSTSPNYQILASLDIGRRQVELEGFELVQKQIEMAMTLRKMVATHPILKKYFRVLTVGDIIPKSFRQSGIESYYDPENGYNDIWNAWGADEFCLDATRVSLFIGETGLDGDTFKNEVLMDKYGIQINKTSRNSVLFMTNIGTTRSSVAYLIEVLVNIVSDLETKIENMSSAERRIHNANVKSIVEDVPPLPDFSYIHHSFCPDDVGKSGEGDIRSAFFKAYDEDNCEYISLSKGDVDRAIDAGQDVVSASFVIPYPPGFPILVPGQVADSKIVEFLKKLDVKEIHGYRPELGLRVFTQAALQEK